MANWFHEEQKNLSSEQGRAALADRDKRGRAWVRVAVSALALLAMCTFIFVMSAKPADDSDALSLGVAWHVVSLIVPGYDQLPAPEQLQWQQTLNPVVRKAAHFLEYAVLGMLAMNLAHQLVRVRAPGGRLPLRIFFAAWVFCILYAVSDEVHQLFVPGRSGQFSDVLLDSLGALAGIVLRR